HPEISTGRRRQFDLPMTAFKKIKAEIALQLADLKADRRFRELQLQRRPLEAEQPPRRLEGTQCRAAGKGSLDKRGTGGLLRRCLGTTGHANLRIIRAMIRQFSPVQVPPEELERV